MKVYKYFLKKKAIERFGVQVGTGKVRVTGEAEYECGSGHPSLHIEVESTIHAEI